MVYKSENISTWKSFCSEGQALKQTFNYFLTGNNNKHKGMTIFSQFAGFHFGHLIVAISCAAAKTCSLNVMTLQDKRENWVAQLLKINVLWKQTKKKSGIFGCRMRCWR
jgi:hypothetical protein